MLKFGEFVRRATKEFDDFDSSAEFIAPSVIKTSFTDKEMSLVALYCLWYVSGDYFNPKQIAIVVSPESRKSVFLQFYKELCHHLEENLDTHRKDFILLDFVAQGKIILTNKSRISIMNSSSSIKGSNIDLAIVSSSVSDETINEILPQVRNDKRN